MQLGEFTNAITQNIMSPMQINLRFLSTLEHLPLRCTISDMTKIGEKNVSNVVVSPQCAWYG